MLHVKHVVGHRTKLIKINKDGEVLGKRRSEEEHVEDVEIKEYVNKKRKEECVLSADIIIHEILPWVPLKALFRFKLVCKEWCRVISTDTLFQKTQSRRCASLSPVGIIYHGLKNYVLLPTTIGGELVGLPNLSLNKYKRMCDESHFNIDNHHNHSCARSLLASSNGLLCGSYFRERTEYFYVSNPLTQELVYIPNTHKLRDVALAFETSTDHPYYVLVGRRVANTDYHNKITDVSFTVYSSKLGIWKVADAKAQIFRPCFGRIWLRTLSRSVFIGGKLHWKLAKDVLWFDIKKNSAGVVALPDSGRLHPYGAIGEGNGVLSYIDISDSFHIGIWFLTSYQKTGFEWVKRQGCLMNLRKILEDNTKLTNHNFHTMVELTENLSFGCNFAHALPYEGGDVVMFWMSKTNETDDEYGVVLSYNMKTESLQLNYESELEQFAGPSLISYKTSLVSLPKQSDRIL